jgi:hypothetical protein
MVGLRGSSALGYEGPAHANNSAYAVIDNTATTVYNRQ